MYTVCGMSVGTVLPSRVCHQPASSMLWEVNIPLPSHRARQARVHACTHRETCLRAFCCCRAAQGWHVITRLRSLSGSRRSKVRVVGSACCCWFHHTLHIRPERHLPPAPLAAKACQTSHAGADSTQFRHPLRARQSHPPSRGEQKTRGQAQQEQHRTQIAERRGSYLPCIWGARGKEDQESGAQEPQKRITREREVGWSGRAKKRSFSACPWKREARECTRALLPIECRGAKTQEEGPSASLRRKWARTPWNWVYLRGV